ncbi:MAG: flagellar basal body rod protein FlgB [Deltaproteobacteria bacterium]|nr:flagellar basal body rod protein FlgB [Deltaproteobacteria bacterium]
MSTVFGGVFNFADRLQMASLDQRLKRSEVISGNIANAETPGFRALGYDFEDQLASMAKLDGKVPIKVSNEKHFRNAFTQANGKMRADVYVKPTESVGEDGNTVDIDDEMVRMAQNQMLYRSAVEVINRKVGMLRYAINGGRG